MVTAVTPTPVGKKYTLAANTPLYIPGAEGVTVHIQTGTTANVFTTLDDDADIAAETADWVPWADGSKAGPWLNKTVGQCKMIKLLSVVGGTVFVAR